tara:strand:- start:553 stop:2301 length:1749 start_codon:yes stop_codon:yes gene_type:complete
MVPTYTNKASVPGSTGMQGVPLSLATSPLSGMGEGMTQVASALDAAGQRIQRREDVINRSRDENAFKTMVSTEWQRVQDEGLTTATMQGFNSFVQDNLAKTVAAHQGSPDSSALLDSTLSGVASTFERSAISATRTAQIEELSKTYSDKLNPILNSIADGSTDYAAAVTSLNAFASGEGTVGEALPDSNAMDLYDSALSLFALASIDRDLSKGNAEGVKAAREKFNENPSFATILTPAQLLKITKRISDQEYAINTANIEYATKRTQFAIDNGYSDYNSVPPHLKLLYASEGKAGGPTVPLTEAGKVAFDRRNLMARNSNDPDSPEVKAFDALIADESAAISQSPTGKLFTDLKAMKDAGVPENDPARQALQAEINEKNPEYVAARDRAEKWPNASISFKDFNNKALALEADAKKALMYLTNEETYADALKAVKNGKFSIYTTGFVGSAMSLRGGSNINELNSILTRIGGSAMLDALSQLKASSPTGASGMGALNETEGNALRFQKGALDIKAPATTAQTLIDLIDGTNSTIRSQEAALKSAFPTLGADIKAMFADAKTNNGGDEGDDEPIKYDAKGNPVRG